jgi:hypothetical protein
MKLRLIKENLEPITLEEINNFENSISFKLPLDYKDFLLENNGAIAKYDCFKVKKVNNEGGIYEQTESISRFNSLKELMYSNLTFDNHDLTKIYLDIAECMGGNSYIYLSLNQETYGYVYWSETTHQEEFIFVSKTFNNFINNFQINPYFDD